MLRPREVKQLAQEHDSRAGHCGFCEIRLPPPPTSHRGAVPEPSLKQCPEKPSCAHRPQGGAEGAPLTRVLWFQKSSLPIFSCHRARSPPHSFPEMAPRPPLQSRPRMRFAFPWDPWDAALPLTYINRKCYSLSRSPPTQRATPPCANTSIHPRTL